MAPRPTSDNRAPIPSGIGDSWVVNTDSEDDGQQGSSSSDYSPPPTRRNSSRKKPSHSEQELIMPSIHEGRVEGALHTNSRTTSTQPTPPKALRSRTSKQSQSHGRPRFQPDQDHKKRISYVGSRSYRAEQDEISAAEKLLSAVGSLLQWVGDILGGALKVLTKPLSLVVALYLFAGLVMMLHNLLTQSIYSALSPLCRIPGVSFLALPICRTGPLYGNASTKAVVEFDRLMKIQDQFQGLLESATEEMSWPVEMKSVQGAVVDVRAYVEASDLESKEEMIVELDGFIDTAHFAIDELMSFNSHVGRGVDHVLINTRFTQRALSRAEEIEGDRGAVQKFFQDTLFTPFQPWRARPNTIIRQYIQHTKDLTIEVEMLLDEAQSVVIRLKKLEDHVNNLNKLRHRDDASVRSQKDEIMASLWTSFGANRRHIYYYNRKLKILEAVREYRETAWNHIALSMVQLREMQLELDQLKQRMTIEAKTETGEDFPLARHLEDIRLGIERLETSRRDSKAAEQDYFIEAGARHKNRRLPEDGMRFVQASGLPGR